MLSVCMCVCVIERISIYSIKPIKQWSPCSKHLYTMRTSFETKRLRYFLTMIQICIWFGAKLILLHNFFKGNAILTMKYGCYGDKNIWHIIVAVCKQQSWQCKHIDLIWISQDDKHIWHRRVPVCWFDFDIKAW